MKNSKIKIFALMIIAVLLLQGCGNSGTEEDVVQIQDDGSFMQLRTRVQPVNLTVISEEHLESVFGRDNVQTSRSAQIEPGKYVFALPNATEAQEANSTNIYVYSVYAGLISKTTLDKAVGHIIYDEKQERIILQTFDLKFWEDYHAYERLGEIDVVIAFDLNLEEKWRIEVPPFIEGIVVTGDFYYIIRRNQEAYVSSWFGISNEFARPGSVGYVDKVCFDGNIVATFSRENFLVSEIITHDDSFIILGEQSTSSGSNAIVMYGDKDTFFTEKYIAIEDQEIQYGIIANGILMLTGIRGELRRNPYYFLSLINLDEMNLVSTIDISRVTSRYGLRARGIFYGENESQIGIIGISNFSRGLIHREIEILFIPISDAIEVSSVYVIDIDSFDVLNIKNISTSGRYIHIVIDRLAQRDPKDNALVEVSIRTTKN